jgi:two-component system sensor histidine kinase KdpD
MIDRSEFANKSNILLTQDLSKKRPGKHRIYIGMSAGVGKTYRMLEESHQLKEEGVDVVIGFLETHGREETAEVAKGLEIVPRQAINYEGITLTEMDAEAILARQPQLVLIDELAHTNIPGSPREKRYQDVEVILEAGIDVFSTVNIQHFESLNDVVAKITGVIVREKVPDRLLDEADEVIVVDVTPETLQERLREGKIYAPEKIDRALQNFFQRHHLVALRELALREVADNLGEEAESTNSDSHQFSIKERILVCVSTYPNSVKLLRRGARLASQMRARLYALYISHPEKFLSKDETLYLETCEKLCQQFGGNFLRVESSNIPQGIAEVAHQHHITQVVLGQTQKSRWQLFLKGSPIYQLIRYLKDTDLHIISTNNDD